MRRLSSLILGLFVAAVGACSLLNVPDDIQTGGMGGTDGGDGKCDVASDCPPATQTCRAAICDETHHCQIGVAADDAACDDLEPCTTGDKCSKGVCVPGPPTDCSAADSECSKGVCKLGAGCDTTPLKEGITCDAANPCAASLCQGGKCTIKTVMNQGGVCDDGLFCTTGEKCDTTGHCTSTQPTCTTTEICVEAVCDEDNNMCTSTQIGEGQPCEDGDVCTGGETCSGNVCNGGVPPKAFFSDDFSTDKKWTLGKDWQIASAMVSINSGHGADPPEDHSPSTDNKIAGVVIGGDAPVEIHPLSFLESPSVDVSAGTGKVFITYYRWLNSDFPPYMRSVVEVFDGANWQQVWTSPDNLETRDAQWTFFSHDVTAFKNAAMKVRFGFEIGNLDVFPIGSWNLDDVKLQNAPCAQ
jgi:hypothetical protein